MKIFFDYSGRGVSKLGQNYKLICETIESLGHTNLRELTTESYRQHIYDGDQEARIEHYRQTMNFIKQADMVVIEVTIHSLSLGYIMQRALSLNKPVVALYLEESKPVFAEGIDNEKLLLVEYTQDDLASVLKEAISYSEDQQDSRFNFFVSPQHQNYLSWIAHNRRIPRSVLLRKLIESEMESDTDYNTGKA